MLKLKKLRPQGSITPILIPFALMVWGGMLLAIGWREGRESPFWDPFILIGGIWVALGLTKIVDLLVEKLRRRGRGLEPTAAVAIIALAVVSYWLWWVVRG